MFVDDRAQNIDQVFWRKAATLLNCFHPGNQYKKLTFQKLPERLKSSAVILVYVSWGYDTPEVRKHLYVQYR